MTRAQLMNTALPTIEGLYAAYAKLFPPYTPQPWSFCVIGPTRDELAALAPTVLEFLGQPSRDDAHGLHLPVQAGDSLRAVAETFSDWYKDYIQVPWGLCILLPEGVVADWPDGQSVFTSEMLRCLHPTLLLADLLQNALYSVLVAIPDSALIDTRGRDQRSLLAWSVILRNHEEIIRDLIPAGQRQQLERVIQAFNHGSAKFLDGLEPESPPRLKKTPGHSGLHKVWTNRGYGSGLWPRFVWTHRTDANNELISVASLSCRGDEAGSGDGSVRIPLATHLRRLSAAMTRDLYADPSAVEHLARVALGEADRIDDDRFVPIWELGPSGQWGAGGETDRDLDGFRGIAATRGHELRRLDSLARIEACEEWSPGESRPNTLWFVAQGTDVLHCLRTAPRPPEKARHESDEEHEANMAKWNAARQQIRLLTLNDCVDADYLWLAMADNILHENLRCRGAKTYWSPIIPVAVLAETLVPWPTQMERKRVVDAFQESIKLIAKSDADSEIDELSSFWFRKKRTFVPSNASPVSARDVMEEALELKGHLAKPVLQQADSIQTVREMINAGESATVEFKSTARWDVKQNQPGKHIERIIVKTIAAFLNTAGGKLVIGVEDDGVVYGLSEDYKLSGGNRDGFELWLMQSLLNHFGKDAAGQIAVAFHELDKPDPARPRIPGDGDVCVVSVNPSFRPRFVVVDGQEIFFIRTGNATNSLKPSEFIGYCRKRWPDS